MGLLEGAAQGFGFEGLELLADFALGAPVDGAPIQTRGELTAPPPIRTFVDRPFFRRATLIHA